MHQFVEDYAVDLDSLLTLRAHVFQSAFTKFLRIQFTFHHMTSSHESDAMKSAVNSLLSAHRRNVQPRVWQPQLDMRPGEMDSVGGANEKVGTHFRQLIREDSINSPTTCQSRRAMHLIYSASECECIETSG